MPDFLVGLDLGQASDPTALAVLKRSLALSADGLPERDDRGDPLYRFSCVHLHRFPCGTPYPQVVAKVARLLASPLLGGRPRLAIDATGVGRPVVDMFLAGRPAGFWCYPVTITGATAGGEARRAGWGAAEAVGYWVPKIELVSAVQAGLQSGRLKIVPSLELADTLKQELLRFQVRLTAAAHETFGAWREGAHDDLVLAVAMAVWLGRRRELRYEPVGADSRESAALAGEARHQAESLARIDAAVETASDDQWHRIDNPYWWRNA